MRITIFLSLLLLSNFTKAQQIPQITGSAVNAADAKKFLAHHNKVRAQVGVGELKWSAKLSTYAQAWAEKLATSNNCKLKHSECVDKDGTSLGENLFWGSSSDDYGVINGSYSWYEEKQLYANYKVGEPKWKGTGHYTQMVWKSTTEVGVGVAYCKNGGIIVSASYFPAGNIVGETPY
jgi:uncharacterized protein YkwD